MGLGKDYQTCLIRDVSSSANDYALSADSNIPTSSLAVKSAANCRFYFQYHHRSCLKRQSSHSKKLSGEQLLECDFWMAFLAGCIRDATFLLFFLGYPTV